MFVFNDEDTRKRARGLFRSAPNEDSVESINHTDHTPLRLRAIAVSMETKKFNGELDEGKTQLCVWAAAYVLRLRSLVCMDKVDITFPLILIIEPE